MTAAAAMRSAVRSAPIGVLGLALALPVCAVLIAGLRPASLEVLTEVRTWRVIGFTVVQALLSTAVSVLLALPAAYALHRLRPRGARIMAAILTVPFVLPTIVVGLALRILLPTGLSGTLTAIVIAHALFNIGLAVRIIGGLWSHLDTRMLDVARTLGVGPLTVWRRVTWPFLRPAVLSAAVLVGLFTFTSFGVIVVLGSRPTIEVEIYRRTVQLLDIPAAAGLALLQAVIVIAALLISGRVQRAVAVRQRLAPITPVRPRTAADRIAVAWTATLAVLVCIPLGALILRSVRVGDGWGFEWYARMVAPTELTTRSTPAWESVLVSLRYAVIATLIAVALGACVAVTLARRRRTAIAEAIALLPLGVSAVTVGFGLLLLSIHGPADLRGTWLLVPIGQALVAAPLVALVLLPVLRAIDPRLRSVAATLGAPPRRIWWAVDGAVLRRHLPIATGLAAAVSLGEFGATAFLARSDAPTIPLQIVRLLGRPGEANIGIAAALCVLLLALTGAALLVADRFRPRWG